MFASMLDGPDASRATLVIEKLIAHAFPMALTGGFAIEARLRAEGRPSERRPLNDLDFVVDSFATIPSTVADDFLLHHVHPFAVEGKMLLQLIDPEQAVRVDLFRAFGCTLSRSNRLGSETDPLQVLAVEDLVARATGLVCAVLGRGRPLDGKHANAFRRLAALGERDRLEEAWRDHREDLSMSFDEAIHEALHLLQVRQDLLVDEQYSPAVSPCARCQNYGSFRRSTPDSIVRILGYW